MQSKKAAVELSVTTIIVIVLSVTLLILGMVFIRGIMCGAISLTGEVNSKVENELNRLFGATGAEVQCIGSSGEAVKMVPGKENIVYCGIKASKNAQYEINVIDISATQTDKSKIQKWIISNSWKGNVAPGDETPKKPVRLKIPDNAAEDTLIIQIEIKKDGELISTQDLDFEISRTGLVKAAIC